ncbi:MAG: protein kinase [Myxococcales bacterium]|nr:protein kinase [Myxococcales bacterium]
MAIPYSQTGAAFKSDDIPRRQDFPLLVTRSKGRSQLIFVGGELEPANVMVCESVADSASQGAGGLRPVLMDFGLARDSLGPQRLTQTGVIMGTPHYMAPEQARGQARHLDRRADVYSLGAMLYELLCGKPPFEAENEVDLLMAVLHQDPTLLRQKESGIPIDLEVIAHKCLRKEPAHRYDSAQALAEDLGRYLRGEPILARPATTLYKLRRLAARHRAPFAVGVVVLLAVFTVLTMWGQARAQRKRAEVQAAEQERLASQLGQSVTEMKLFLRVAYSLPPHDLRRDYEVVRSRLHKLQGQLTESDPFLHGTIESALGQGYLALQEFESAVSHLQRAIDLGENTMGSHLALGESLTQLYQAKAADIMRRTEPADAKLRVAELAQLYLPRARRELELGRNAELASPSYVQSLLLRYADKPDLEQALAAARKAKEESPWQLEPMVQELRIIATLAQELTMTGRNASEEQIIARQQLIENAISTARSYPEFYRMYADFALMQIKEGLTDPKALVKRQPMYQSAVEKSKTLTLLLSTDGSVYDQLAEVHSSWAFLLAWYHQDPRPVTQEGLRILAESQKLLPERIQTSRVRMRLHMARANHLMYLDESSEQDYQESLAAAKRAMELAPQEADSWSQLALAASYVALNKQMHGIDARDDLRQTVEYAKRSIKQKPEHLLLRNNLGAYYLILAQEELVHGVDPHATWQLGQSVLQEVLQKNPNFAMSEQNRLEFELEEVSYLLRTAQDAVAKAQVVSEHAGALAQKYPASFSMLQMYVTTLLRLAEALIEQGQSPQKVLSEAEAMMERPEFVRGSRGVKEDLLAEVSLLRLRFLVRTGGEVSPESSLLKLREMASLRNIAEGGMRAHRQLLQLEGLRRYAEWLSAPQPRSLGNSKELPKTARTAVEEGLLLAKQALDRPGKLRHDLQSEQAILLLLKAKLLPQSEAPALIGQAKLLTEDAIKARPLLRHKLRPYLTWNPG